ncbi:hypothetical protein JTB14_018277 [Gonioctena quinquepunctata]|nr:hypothetical protein JTB14_018277 [Gonioctena quinquepunctata]
MTFFYNMKFNTLCISENPTTGIPFSGTAASSYCLNVPHNYNYVLHSCFFPDICSTPKIIEKPLNPAKTSEKKRDHSVDNKKGKSLDLNGKQDLNGRQDRYERMLSQGHKSALTPCKITKESHSLELKKKIVEMLQGGKKITQREARKTFSHYLVCILKRIVAGPDQEDHVEIVLKFLQRASNYLKSSFSVNTPSNKLAYKDKAAIIANS